MTSRTARTATLAASAVLSLGAVAAAAVPAGAAPTGEAAAPSCGFQCITQATVDATASGATVRVVTSAPAGVTVRVSPAAAPLDEAAGPSAPGGISNLALLTDRSFTISDLAPDTEYRIVVEARDGYGATSTRIGTFRTRAVETALEPPATGLVSPDGCSVDCITRAVALNSRDIAGRTRLTVDTQVPAKVRIELIRRSTGGAVLERRITQSARPGITFSHALNGLAPGTRYEATVRATDAAGVHEETGVFRTADAVADVTFHRVRIVSDGDAGPNRGEIYLYFGSTAVSGGKSTHRWGDVTWDRYGSDSLVDPPARADAVLPVNGSARLALEVESAECDAARISTCHVGRRGTVFAAAAGSWTLRDLPKAGALPPWSGTGVAPPAGHDHYVVLQDLSGPLQFQALAMIDVRVVS